MITKRTKIFLAVLVVVALCAHVYLYWWSTTADHGVFDTIPAIHNASESASKAVRPNAQPPAAETPATNEDGTPAAPLSYTGYENTEYRFSLSYPETWQPALSKNENDVNVCFKPADATGGCRLNVRLVSESVNVSMENTLEALAAEYRAGNVKTSSRRIGGEAAAVLSVSGYPAGEEKATRAAVFVHEGKVYTVTAQAGQEAVFDKAVTTFLFGS